jgi:hypothetical protein
MEVTGRSRHSGLTPGKESQYTVNRGSVDPTAGLYILNKKKKSRPCWHSNPGPYIQQPTLYMDYAIQAHIRIISHWYKKFHNHMSDPSITVDVCRWTSRLNNRTDRLFHCALPTAQYGSEWPADTVHQCHLSPHHAVPCDKCNQNFQITRLPRSLVSPSQVVVQTVSCVWDTQLTSKYGWWVITAKQVWRS